MLKVLNVVLFTTRVDQLVSLVYTGSYDLPHQIQENDWSHVFACVPALEDGLGEKTWNKVQLWTDNRLKPLKFHALTSFPLRAGGSHSNIWPRKTSSRGRLN